jgi:hypothetical protein
MFEFVFGLIVGSLLGYGLRAFISHRRRIATKQRLGMS